MFLRSRWKGNFSVEGNSNEREAIGKWSANSELGLDGPLASLINVAPLKIN